MIRTLWRRKQGLDDKVMVPWRRKEEKEEKQKDFKGGNYVS